MPTPKPTPHPPAGKPASIRLKAVRRALLTLLLTLMIYFTAGSVIPNVGQLSIPPALVRDFDRGAFLGSGIGPDRAGLIESPLDAMAVRVALIRSARRRIDLTTHTIHDDPSGRALLGELLAANERGVEVRLVVDGKVGMGGGIDSVLRDLSGRQGFTVLLYNTMKWGSPATWHALLHDKLMLVDEQYLLCGGRNLGDRYFAPQGTDARKVAYDRDALIYTPEPSDRSVCHAARAYIDSLEPLCAVQTPASGDKAAARLAALSQETEAFFAQNPDFTARDLAAFTAQTVPTHKVSLLFNPVDCQRSPATLGWQLGQLMLGAEHSVIVQTPYATANQAVLDVFAALPEGVSARYLTNSVATSPNFPAFSDYYARRTRFVAAGLDIYEYQGSGSIHGKSMVIDGRLSAVGSLNLDDRSLYLDTEAMLVIDSPEFAGLLEDAMGRLMDQSLRLGADNTYLPGQAAEAEAALPRRMLMGAMGLFSRVFRFLI